MTDAATQQAVVQETLGRIAKHKGVFGYLVLNPKDGSILQSAGFEGKKGLMEAYAERLGAYATLAHSMVRTLDHRDQFTFMRLRMRFDTSKMSPEEAAKRKGTTREVILAPDPDRERKDYLLVVVQDCPTARPVEERAGRPPGLPDGFAGLGGTVSDATLSPGAGGASPGSAMAAAATDGAAA